MKFKTTLYIILYLLVTTNLLAQETQNIADLDFLYNSIRKLPSYIMLDVFGEDWIKQTVKLIKAKLI